MAKEYRNAIRSKKMIRNAYSELVSEKKNLDVTVKEIVERADVSKSTIYAHYKDINAVSDEIIDEAIENLKSLVNLYDGNDTDPILQINSFFDTLNEHIEEYKRLFLIDYPSRFMAKFRKLIRELEVEYPNMTIVASNNQNKKNGYITFFIMGLMELLMGYLYDPTSLSLDEIREIVIDIYNRLCK